MAEIRTLDKEATESTAAPKKTAPSTPSKGSKQPKKTSQKAVSSDASSAFAIIATGGKQYKVSEGDLLKIEIMPGDHKVGDTLTFNEVLLTGGEKTAIGAPLLNNGSVTGELVAIGRSPKVTVIKYKQKSRYFKKNGHRQPFFQVKITGIK